VATLSEMRENCRQRLGEPLPQSPTPKQTLQAVCTHVQSLFFNRLANTGRAWTVGEPYRLTVSAGRDEYTLNVGSEWGKALDVYTIDASNQYFISRSIPFWNVQDIHFNWSDLYGYDLLSPWPGMSPHTAQSMAFYRTPDGSVYVKIQPKPQLSTTYEILFSTGAWAGDASLDESPLLVEHHALPEVRACISLLPLTKWEDDAKENRERRKEFAMSLKNDEEILLEDYQNYVRNINGSRMSRMATLSFDY
jgi:hypothetical protein